MTPTAFRQYIEKFKQVGQVPFFAHRGLSSLAPDNSVRALQLGFESTDVDGVEFDVQRTADNALVIRHHRSVKTATDQVWFEEMSLKEYRKIVDEELSPSFEDVLRLAAQSSKIIDIELKSAGIAEAVVKLCRQRKLLDRVILTTIYADIYTEIRTQFPDIAVMYGYPKDKGKDLAQQKWTQPFVKLIVSYMRWQIEPTLENIMSQVDTPFISMYHKVITPGASRVLHQRDRLCIGCTINLQNDTAEQQSLQAMQSMLDAGVDLIKTDYPQLRSKLRHS